jgi:predicted nucleic acid-binding protein
MLVFDATPIIYLAKVGKLHLIENISEKKVIPGSVFEEVVVKGKEAGKSDALIVERLIEQGVFQVSEVKEIDVYRKLMENKKLSKADVEVLTLAKVENGVAIVDEDYARWVAEVEDIKCGGTIYLISLLLEGGVITKREAREIVNGIIEKGWFCSTDRYARILRRLEEE